MPRNIRNVAGWCGFKNMAMSPMLLIRENFSFDLPLCTQRNEERHLVKGLSKADRKEFSRRKNDNRISSVDLV